MDVKSWFFVSIWLLLVVKIPNWCGLCLSFLTNENQAIQKTSLK
jgi:hypothetical protein